MKRTIEEYLKKHSPAVLNLGCGRRNSDEFFGVDIQDLPSVDLVHDVETGIPVPDDIFDRVFAMDFLEHIEQKKCIHVMEEIYRVLKPGGKLQALVPSTDWVSTGAFQDPTHVSWWNQTKFFYFLDDKYGKRFRSLYNIQTWFYPEHLITVMNEHNVTYVQAILVKPDKKEESDG